MCSAPDPTTAIRIRAATADDLDALVGMSAEIQQLHAELAPWRFGTPQPAETLAWLKERLDDIWIALLEDRPAGMLYAKPQDRPASPFAPADREFLVDQITVFAHLRRRGVSRALMEHAEGLAKEHGCERIELSVLTANDTAVAFYEAQGYEIAVQRMVRRLGG